MRLVMKTSQQPADIPVCRIIGFVDDASDAATERENNNSKLILWIRRWSLCHRCEAKMRDGRPDAAILADFRARTHTFARNSS